MKKTLEQSGYEVTIAQDEKETTGVSSENVFDVIACLNPVLCHL